MPSPDLTIALRQLRGAAARRVVIGCLLGLLPLCSALPAAAQFSPVQGREYREIYNPTNPVRGEAVVGIAIVPPDGTAQGRVVEVWLPDGLRGELHVETASADGRFRGEGAYAGSGAGRTWARLELTPAAAVKTPPPLPGDPRTLALAVRGSGRTFYAARWVTQPAAPPQKLRVYVNSRRADMFVRAGARVVRCVALNITQLLRFDSYCDVALSDVPADGQMVLIRRDQSDEQTQTFTVHMRDLP